MTKTKELFPIDNLDRYAGALCGMGMATTAFIGSNTFLMNIFNLVADSTATAPVMAILGGSILIAGTTGYGAYKLSAKGSAAYRLERQ